MNLYKNPAERRKLIMEHYSKPLNKKNEIAKTLKFVEHFSKTCVDKIILGYQWTGNKLVKLEFSGVGCAIFISSADIMISKIKGRTKQEIKLILTNYYAMINSEKYDEELLGKLVIFANVKAHLNRLNCAMMIYETLIKTINDDEKLK